ncbi:MAG: hypothetical protein EOM62_11835 [Bacteroidia bacterium]|nr:hypothetical protein [Bacteroidia bacterium]
MTGRQAPTPFTSDGAQVLGLIINNQPTDSADEANSFCPQHNARWQGAGSLFSPDSYYAYMVEISILTCAEITGCNNYGSRRYLLQYSNYLREILLRAPKYLDRGWKSNNGKSQSYFADPTSGENGLRTHGNVAFTYALLGSNSFGINGLDDSVQHECRKHAIRAFSYMVLTHKTGDTECAAGGTWGLGWQSSWWAAKMAHGAKLLWPQLGGDLRMAVERVVVSEASNLLDRSAPTGLFEDTKAEENAWETEILAVAMGLFPNHTAYSKWRDKLIEFSINTFSCPQDQIDINHVDGKAVREQVYTTNVHSDFTLENHGSWHFCYYASPLASLAWSWYALASVRQDIPQSLFHHYRDVWERVKPTFLNGRFAYISGKDWARYTYGLYFILPALMLLATRFQDKEAIEIMELRLRQLLWEQNRNGDGSFFGDRVSKGLYYGQYAKYETDCYAHIGLTYLILKEAREKLPDEIGKAANLNAVHVSMETGTAFARTDGFFASFSSKTLTTPYPAFFFGSPSHDDLFEWQQGNLTGLVTVFGDLKSIGVRVLKRHGKGFFVQERVAFTCSHRGRLYEQQLEINVDPEIRSAVIRSKAIALRSFFCRRIEPVRLCIANDIFNGCVRRYIGQNCTLVVHFDEKKAHMQGMIRHTKITEKIKREINWGGICKACEPGWLNIDDIMSIADLSSSDRLSFVVTSPIGRNVHDESLHFDVVTLGYPTKFRFVKRGDILFDTNIMVFLASAEESKERLLEYTYG